MIYGGDGGDGLQWLFMEVEVVVVVDSGWLLTEFVYGDPPLSCTFAFPFY